MDKLYLIGLAIPGILKMHNVVNDVIILRVIHKYLVTVSYGMYVYHHKISLFCQSSRTTRLC